MLNVTLFNHIPREIIVIYLIFKKLISPLKRKTLNDFELYKERQHVKSCSQVELHLHLFTLPMKP